LVVFTCRIVYIIRCMYACQELLHTVRLSFRSSLQVPMGSCYHTVPAFSFENLAGFSAGTTRFLCEFEITYDVAEGVDAVCDAAIAAPSPLQTTNATSLSFPAVTPSACSLPLPANSTPARAQDGPEVELIRSVCYKLKCKKKGKNLNSRLIELIINKLFGCAVKTLGGSS
jgi:hypothetical protein